jgi:dipeptidase D
MNNQTIRTLEPLPLWNFFADLNAIPRASKREQQVIAFMKDFGESLHLPTMVDEAGNVLIRKPATSDCAHLETIVLQSHLDMVHQKNEETIFDFDTQGIQMFVDGDWVKADGTTLGADNGIGVAAIMALLASDTISHPAIEALFTIDEETGMTGALALKGGLLQGNILLNLDTEEDDELTIGCAGGIDVTATGQYPTTSPSKNHALQLTLKGLNGGHSGMEIHKGLGNANKLMNRLLRHINNHFPLEISTIQGGGLRNAIPRESSVIIVIDRDNFHELKDVLNGLQDIFQNEYQKTDPNLLISYAETGMPEQVMEQQFQQQLLRCLSACPNGIYRMSPDIDRLVQSSNNLARVQVSNGSYSIQCLTRSSVDSEKEDLAETISAVFELMGASIAFSGSYPGWKPKPDATIVSLMSTLYRELFKKEAHVSACHAGLECGILGRNYPDMQMISFGPTIHGAHSPDERVQISSVQKFWHFFTETLSRIPVKQTS